ncbi:MAG: glycosyltransferase family 4 protein, partial [Planctomycetes bacterium]|nr:glycosyltransferase family 4 protein [Planctomycetota bacterium]
MASTFSPPLRVMFVNPFTELGGAEHSLLALLATLPEGVQAQLVTESEGALAAEAAALGVASRYLPFPSAVHPRAIFRSVRTLAEWMRADADLVHANSPRAAFFAGLAARRAEIPVIWHLRCYVGSGVRAFLLRRLVTRTIGNSHAALANAGFAPADPRACVIPNGVPQALLLSEPRARNRGGCGGGAGDDLPVIGMA